VAEAGGDFLGRWPGAARVFAVILATLVVNAVGHWILTLFAARAKAARHTWADALLGSISAPLQGVVWLIGLTAAYRILTEEGNLSLLQAFFPPARDVAIIALIAWFALRVVHRAQHNIQNQALARGQELDPTATDAISKLVRAAIIITAGLVIMQTLGFSISGLLAFGGIGGIAIGFAAQGLVANLFGGLTIYASRPFKVGEWIILSGSEVMGQVQQIGWRATRVLGYDRQPFYVPNAMFNTAVVVNQSRMTNRRITQHLHVRYQDIDKVEGIIKEGNQLLAEYPDIDHGFFVFRFDTCGDSSLKLFLYAFTVSTAYVEYMRVKEDLLLKIAAIVRRHGAELATPATTLYAPDGIPFHSAQAQLSDEPAQAGMAQGNSEGDKPAEMPRQD
jgi:MscS family membrane protein